MSMLELNTLRQTPLVTEPFEYLIVPQFVKAEPWRRLNATSRRSRAAAASR